MSIERYRKIKSEIIEILCSKTNIEKVEKIPDNDNEFTFENGIQSWVAALFIDIRDSTNYFKDNKNEKVARVMRAFTSEIISYLCLNDNYREIGIRGDCIYAIYSTPKKDDLKRILSDAIYINTFQKMFQEILYENGFETFEIGIGLGCSNDLIIKAGKIGTGISNKIWLGNAVIDASNLSSLGNKGQYPPILLNSCFYNNVYEFKANDNYTYQQYFNNYLINSNTECYGCDMITIDFNDWIEHGMK